MKGSEKQIAWATEIMNKVNPVMDWTIANAPENLKSRFTAIKETVNNAYAGKIIDCFADVVLGENAQQNAKAVFGAYTSYQKISMNKF